MVTSAKFRSKLKLVISNEKQVRFSGILARYHTCFDLMNCNSMLDSHEQLNRC